MKNIKYILFIIALLAISTFTIFAFNSSKSVEVGSFYVTKQYANAFEVNEKPFYDTVQVLAIQENSIKYVGWIGWEFVESKEEFNASFVPCKDCSIKSTLTFKVRYEDRRR